LDKNNKLHDCVPVLGIFSLVRCRCLSFQ